MTLQLALKILITVVLVVAVSLLSRRPGVAGALVASLPATSLLVLGWRYAETRDAVQVADMAMDILWFVLGSLPFFPVLAYTLRKGLHPGLGFPLAALAGFAGVTLTQWLLTRTGSAA